MRVIDTSVVLKWYVDEEDSSRADTLVGTGLVAPDLILAELGNALWKKLRRAEVSVEQARAAIAGLGVTVSLLPTLPFAPRAFDISVALNHPVYDCFFIATAEEYESTVVTADRRLLKACAGTAFEKFVTSLG